MIQFGWAVSLLLGIFLLLCLFVSKMYLSTIPFFIMALLLLPPIRRYIYSKTNFKFPLYARALSLIILFIIGVVIGIKENEINKREDVKYFNNNAATILSEVRKSMSSKDYQTAESLSAKYLASDNEELLKLHFDAKWGRQKEEAKARIDEIKRKPFNDRTAGEHAELAKDEYEHKSEYEKGMDLARELDRMNTARRLDDIARDHNAIDRYRQYK